MAKKLFYATQIKWSCHYKRASVIVLSSVTWGVLSNWDTGGSHTGPGLRNRMIATIPRIHRLKATFVASALWAGALSWSNRAVVQTRNIYSDTQINPCIAEVFFFFKMYIFQ